MARKKIPERVEVTCDLCKSICDESNCRLNGIIEFKYDGLDLHGIAVGSAGWKRDVCDSCLKRAQQALADEFENKVAAS